jgi:hypothetical protein
VNAPVLHWRRVALWLASHAVLVAGCAGSVQQNTQKAVPAPPEPSAEASKASLLQPCGPRLRLSTYAFVPDDVRLAAAIDLDDAGLERGLGHVAALARNGGHAVPIVAAITLAYLGTQVRGVELALDRAGLGAAEIVLVVAQDGAQAWVWRSTCDLAVACKHVEQAWGVRVRDTAGGYVGSPPTQDPGSFPLAVLFLPGDLMALVPSGQAARFRLWLTMGRSRASTSAPAPAVRLGALAPAPVRIVVSDGGLLGSTAGTPAQTARHVRATAQGVEIDGKHWRPRL